MVEGDEWKFSSQEEWNTPEKIFRDEYTSIINAFYENVLRPVVQRGQRIDRNAISMTNSDLEWKLNDSNLKKLPFQIQNAYRRFKQLVDVLENTIDEEIEILKDVLHGLFLLGTNCNVYGNSMKDLYIGRNPCRNDQYVMNSAIKNAEERLEDSKLLEASRGMVDVCKKCPYR